MTALALSRPILSPLDLVMALVDAARKSVDVLISQAVLQYRLGALEDTVTRLVRETRTEFCDLGDRDLQQLLLQFARRHWAGWLDAVRLSCDLATQTGIKVERIARDAPDALRRLSEELEESMPYLPREARVSVRTGAALLADIVARDPRAVPLPTELDEVVTLFGSAEVQQDEVALVAVACLHVLSVAGTHGGIDPRVSTNIAFFLLKVLIDANRIGQAAVQDALRLALRRDPAEIVLSGEALEHLSVVLRDPPPAPAALKDLLRATRPS